MYKQRKVLCFILARGGSKGLPNKNILNIAGKPLIAHSIDIAKEVSYIDEIYVSTEDKQIKEISTIPSNAKRIVLRELSLFRFFHSAIMTICKNTMPNAQAAPQRNAELCLI